MQKLVQARVNVKRNKIKCGYGSCSGVLGEILKEPHALLSKCIDPVTGDWLDPLTREWIVVVELSAGYHLNEERVWVLSNGARAREASGRQYLDPYQSKRHRRRYEAGGPLQSFPYDQAPTPSGNPSLYILKGVEQAASWMGWAQYEAHHLDTKVLDRGEDVKLINHRQQVKAPAMIRCAQCSRDSYVTLENLATALPD